VLAATWRERLGCDPPADWLAHAAAAVDVHLARPQTDSRSRAPGRPRGTDDQRRADPAASPRAPPPRRDCRRRAPGHRPRQRHAPGVRPARAAPRLHGAHPSPVRRAVRADCGADAYQAARDTLAEALVPDGDEIEVVWDDVENDGAEPGDIDIDEPDPT